MLSILFTLIGFCILVFFHELGHFIFAKLTKMKVLEFSIGMGPSLFSFKHRETQFHLKLFPIGGYCKIEGQDDLSAKFSDLSPDSFFSKSPYARLITILGGPLFSFLIGIFFIAIFLSFEGQSHLKYTKIIPFGSFAKTLKDNDEILSVNGKKTLYYENVLQAFSLTQDKNLIVEVKRNNEIVKVNVAGSLIPKLQIAMKTKPIIVKVEEDSVANKIGLQKGDVIESINDKSIVYESQVSELIQNQRPNTPITIKIRRYQTDLQTLENLTFEGISNYPSKLYSFSGMVESKEDKNYLGIGMMQIPDSKLRDYVIHQNLNLISAFGLASEKGVFVFFSSLKGILALFSSESSKVRQQISGPVGIFNLLGSSYKSGFMNFINLLGVLSVAIAFFNLIPFPALDGGHILFNLIEIISRRRIPLSFIGKAQIFGVISLLLLLLWSTFRDISNL